MTHKGATILIVDDDAAIRELIARVLGRQGFNLMKAQNGWEALQVYGSYHREIALIVTDIEMPVMDGLEAVDRMRAMHPNVRVIVVTGRPEQLAEAGKDCRVLRKPFTPAQLLASVQLVLNQDLAG